MLDELVNLDKKILIYLNGLGSSDYDGLWLILTKQFFWTPLFLFFAYLVYKKIGYKQTLVLMLFVTVLITFTDQFANLFKYNFQRLRPCNDPEIKFLIRVVKPSYSFSFFSGHAATSMSVAAFLYFILKKHYRFIWLIFLWPLVFAYSRIYLGVHFPSDILAGYFFGMLFGFSMFKLYGLYLKKQKN